MQLNGSSWLSTAPQAAPRDLSSLPHLAPCPLVQGAPTLRAVGSRETLLLLHLHLGWVEAGPELGGGMERCVISGLGTEISGRCVGATQDCLHPGHGRS